MSQERTQQLCYEILDCLKQLKNQPKHVDAPTGLWDVLAQQVIEMQGTGKEAFAAELESVTAVLRCTQRSHHWDPAKYIAARVLVYIDYCRLLSQAIEKFDEPTVVGRAPVDVLNDARPHLSFEQFRARVLKGESVND